MSPSRSTSTHRGGRRAWPIPSPWPVVVLLTLGAPLAIGGVHTPTRIVLAALGLIALALAAGRARTGYARPVSGHVGAALGLLVVVTFLQWLPLPAGLVDLLAPVTAEANARSSAALGQPAPSFLPISLDPARTAAAWLSLLAFWAALIAAAHVARRTGSIAKVAMLVELSALAVFLVGVAQEALGLGRIYGFYASTVDLSKQFFLTSFVSPNHAASLMLLGFATALGLWRAKRADKRASFHLVAAGLLAAGVAATGSRGNIALVVVAGAVLLTTAFFGERDLRERARIARIAAVAVCLAVLGAFLGDSAWLSSIGDGSAPGALAGEVLRRWQVGFDAVAAQPLTGVGHGAFGAEASRVIADWDAGYMDYAHNVVLQAAADWGVPAALALFAAIGVGAARALRGRKTCTATGTGLLVGVVALLAENMADFSLFVPGVGIPACVAAGGLVGALATAPGGSPERRGLRGWWRAPFLPVPLAIVGVAVGMTVPVALHAWRDDPMGIEADLQAELTGDAGAAAEPRELLAGHPSDYFLFHLGALVSLADGDTALADALSARAVELAPRSYHTAIGRLRTLAALGDREGARAAAEHLAGLGESGLRHAVTEVLAHRELLEGFCAADPAYAAAVVRELQRRRDPYARKLLEWASARHPSSIDLREALAGVLAGQRDGEPGLRSLAAYVLGRSATEADPERRKRLRRLGYLARGYLAYRDGRDEQAWHAFSEAARLDPERAARPLVAGGWALVRIGDMLRLGEVIAELRRHEDTSEEARLEVHRFESYRAELRGDLRGAIREMQKAKIEAPGSEAVAKRIEELYRALGR